MMNIHYCLLSVFLANSPEVPLRGVVVDSQGQAVRQARISVAAAYPKTTGRAVLTPSSYLDCSKWTKSDSQGLFEIHNLAANLEFTVSASAPNKQSKVILHVDPLAGELKFVLDAIAPDISGARTVSGRLVDDQGQPIAGALVMPYGDGHMQFDTSDQHWWGLLKVNPTVSDEEGRFRLTLPDDYRGVNIDVTAYGYAGTASLIRPGASEARIVVPVGTRVTARLVNASMPASGLRVAVAQADRRAGRHRVRAIAGVTDGEGRVGFDHLPADEEYVIYSLVGQGRQKLVLTTTKFKALGNGKERHLGDLPVKPAQRLVGRAEMPAGRQLPSDAKVILSRWPALDWITAPVRRDGAFMIEGLPPESYEIRVAPRGVHIDPARFPYQMLDGEWFSFGLPLRQSIEDLRLPVVSTEP